MRSSEATRQRLLDGTVAGAVATLLMTFALLALATVARLPLRVALAVGVLRAHPLGALSALALHLAYGSLAGGLFAVGARRIGVGSGVTFALGMFGVAALVYAPVVGLGPVAARAPGVAAWALPAHLVYGVALGVLVPRPRPLGMPAASTPPG